MPPGQAARTVLARRVAAVLKRGGVAVFPTETVYGIAADPRKRRAMKRLYAAKGRGGAKAVTWQVASAEKAVRLVKKNGRFTAMARAFWPGPLTLVAESRRGGKVGVRVPRHDFALKVLKAYGSPLAVTSANPSGGGDLKTKKDLMAFAEGKVDMVVWGGRPRRSASTVVDLSGPAPVILRQGPIRQEDIRRVAA